MNTHYQILIVGAGNAGISVAAQLLGKNKSLKIGMIDPAQTHYYQPAWTLVGGGTFDITKTARPQQSVMPKGVDWIQDKTVGFDPEQNTVFTEHSNAFTYDYLVVCPGIQLNWNQIKGLSQTLGKNGVCSNYGYELAPYTYQCVKNFKGGNAIFTSPSRGFRYKWAKTGVS